MENIYCKHEPIPYPEVGIEKGFYGKYVQNNEHVGFQPCGSNLIFWDSKFNIETGEEEYRLTVYTETEAREVFLDELTEEKLLSLRKYGINVNAPVLLKVLKNEVLLKDRLTFYESLGFAHDVEGKTFFRGYHAIGVDAHYVGLRGVYPVGEWFEWCRLIDQEIEHWTPLLFVLCASTAGVISDWLQEECIRIHLVGRPFHKDAWDAGLFGVACGSNPYDTEEPLVFESPESFEANEKTIANSFPCLVKGIPTIKGLLDVDGYEKHHTTIFAVSAEENKSATDRSMAVPWLEVSDVIWEKNIYHQYRITEEISENYALWIPVIARLLMHWGKMKTKYRFIKAMKEFKEIVKENEVFQNAPEGVFKQIAMIIVAVEILEDEFECYVSKEDMVKFIIQNVTVTWHEQKKESVHDDREGETTWNMK